VAQWALRVCPLAKSFFIAVFLPLARAPWDSNLLKLQPAISIPWFFAYFFLLLFEVFFPGPIGFFFFVSPFPPVCQLNTSTCCFTGDPKPRFLFELRFSELSTLSRPVQRACTGFLLFLPFSTSSNRARCNRWSGPFSSICAIRPHFLIFAGSFDWVRLFIPSYPLLTPSFFFAL